jgi:hypothetical protein
VTLIVIVAKYYDGDSIIVLWIVTLKRGYAYYYHSMSKSVSCSSYTIDSKLDSNSMQTFTIMIV